MTALQEVAVGGVEIQRWTVFYQACHRRPVTGQGRTNFNIRPRLDCFQIRTHKYYIEFIININNLYYFFSILPHKYRYHRIYIDFIIIVL